jgi:hypothetical protein
MLELLQRVAGRSVQYKSSTLGFPVGSQVDTIVNQNSGMSSSSSSSSKNKQKNGKSEKP